MTGLPWTRAASARCRGLLLAATGDTESALGALERALREHEQLENPFEFGRTLLALGSVQRRAKQKKAAHDSLTRALEIFQRTGARLWAEKARSELARIGGRAPAPDALTASETQVVELVAAGYTNREIAAKLFMSVKTVERHLTHIFRKLNLHSRREVGRAVRARERAQT